MAPAQGLAARRYQRHAERPAFHAAQDLGRPDFSTGIDWKKEPWRHE
jgi:hypothetical protein